MQLGKLGKIGVGWTVLVVVGITGFTYSKTSVDKRRYDNMKVRERMKKSNEGLYEATERFVGGEANKSQ